MNTTTSTRRPSTPSLEARPERIDLDTRKTAVLVIDMQNDFDADGGFSIAPAST